MKKTKLYFKKSLSVFMAAMMLFTAWVFVAPEKADAALVTDTFNLLAYTAITDGSGSRGSSSQITVCSDGEVGNTTVGNIEFNIASFTKPVKKATLNVNTTRNSGTAANSTVKFYLINPSKSLAKSDTYVLNNIASVYGGYYNSATGVNNAYTYFGVSESQALGTIKQTETGAHNFDVTDAVNTAIANGWSRFCLAFIMPQSYADSDSSSWSDIHIQYTGTNLVCEYEESYATASKVSSTNTAALNSIPSFNTDVTTIYNVHWLDGLSATDDHDNDTDKKALYKNVLYSSSNIGSGYTANTGSVNLKDSGAATLQWYHGVTTFLYDGVTTPQTGVMLCTIPKGSSYNIRTYSSYISSGSGLSLAHYWYASDGRANFTYVICAPGNTGAATHDGSVNSTNAWTVNSNTWLANKLQFTGSMSDNEYYRDITVTWGWKGNQKSQNTGNVYTYTATSGNHIYVVNYKPLKAALEEALGTGTYSISTLKNNTAKYTTASMAEYVAAVNALIAAKPNNYVNASTNNYSGYAKAAEAAIKKFTNAKANLTLQKYAVVFESIDGEPKKETEFDYGSSINLNALAPANSVTQIDGNALQHQTYRWDIPANVNTVTDTITVKEVTNTKVNHSFKISDNGDADGHIEECEACGYTRTQSHEYSNIGAVTQAATCESTGKEEFKCKQCDYIKTETIPANGHDFTSGEYLNKEDGKEGTHYQKCNNCGAYGMGTTKDACEKHNWESEAKVLSTCKEQGTETFKCTLCDATYIETLAYADHTVIATEAVSVEGKCGAQGNEAFWSCSVCSKVWTDEALTKELENTADADNDGIPDELETFSAPHVFEGDYKNYKGGAEGSHYRACSVCGKAYGLDGVEGKTESHDFEYTVVTPATCTKKGEGKYTCKLCKNSYPVEIEKAPHTLTYVEAVKATCLVNGNVEYYH